MRRREPAPQLAALGVEVDHDLREEVLLAVHLVEEQPQVGGLVVVDADEDRAGVGQHPPARLEPRPHHRRPRLVPGEGVVVGERAAGVVGRVDVDQVVRRRRQPAEHLEVVALGEGVARTARHATHHPRCESVAVRCAACHADRPASRVTPVLYLTWTACVACLPELFVVSLLATAGALVFVDDETDPAKPPGRQQAGVVADRTAHRPDPGSPTTRHTWQTSDQVPGEIAPPLVPGPAGRRSRRTERFTYEPAPGVQRDRMGRHGPSAARCATS